METVFIDICMSIISTISWFSRPLTISVMAMESLNPVVIARCMAIISWFSGSFAMSIATIAVMAMKSLNPVVITRCMAIISGLSSSLAISITSMAIVTMSTMETVFIDICMSIISTISWFSKSLT